MAYRSLTGGPENFGKNLKFDAVNELKYKMWKHDYESFFKES